MGLRSIYLIAISLVLMVAAAHGTVLPHEFEPNVGQADRRVDFIAHGLGYTLLLARDGAYLNLASPGRALRMRLVGANPRSRGEGLGTRPGKSNYFIGDQRELWRTGIPRFGRVLYRQVYRGIDVAYYGAAGRLEYDFVLGPHADPRGIRLAFEGADRIRIDGSGDLVITVGSAEIRERKPLVYQDTPHGRRAVAAGYVALGGNQVGFRLAPYDTGASVLIDPTLVFSTYFGGNGNENGGAIARDAGGNLYLCGSTASTNLPGSDIGQPLSGGGTAALVAKIGPSGNLISATYVGGAGDQAAAYAVSVDAAQNIYLAGSTNSASFPTQNPVQPVYGGSRDGFVLELNSAGTALVYSTFLGGGGADYAAGLSVDAGGNAYVTGVTTSANFPTWNAWQRKLAGSSDAFAAKIATGGSALVYSTYLGGEGADNVNGSTIDPQGNVYLYGDTTSTKLPVVNAVQSTFCGFDSGQTPPAPPPTVPHGWVGELGPAGSPVFLTYICGSAANDSVRGGALDTSGNLFVTGNTSSTTFPVMNPIQPAYGGGNSDAFVIKLAPGGSLAYSTYLGGSGQEEGLAMAVDNMGNPYVTGYTYSTDFPTVQPIQARNAGAADVFLTKMNAAGSAILFSTYLGGNRADAAFGVAVDSSMNAYIGGTTSSTNFPIMAPLQSKYGGGSNDLFLSVVSTCTFNFSGPGGFTAAGGSGVVYVITSPPCSWTVSSSATWITILTNAYGTGSGSLAISVSPNTGQTRSASLAIGGQTVTITESGPLTITGPGSLPVATVGVAYPATAVMATGGSGTYTWSATGLPPGLTIGVNTGILSGTPANNSGSPFHVQVTVTDSNSATASQSYNLTVNPATALSIAKTHSGNFTQGEFNATYTVTVSSAPGGGPTSGVITVTENPPMGLTLISMAGAGWKCSTSAKTCTRSDALAGGASYPPITVTANVAAGAPSPLVNAVSVSGGGSPAATATDSATINPSTMPTIAPTAGVVNGASFQPGIVPDSWVTITGTNLSPITDTWANAISNGNLPILLDGIGVSVGGQPAYISYVSPGQINALAPHVAAGTVAVTVTNFTGASTPVTAAVQLSQPAFFQWGTYAVATRADYSLAVRNGTFPGTTTAPAKPGDVIILWGTGFGPTSPSAPVGVPVPSGTTYNTANPVTVTVGNVRATVYGAALAPGYAGLYQVAIQIPTTFNFLPAGDYAVVATVGGVQSPASTLITVQP